MNFIYFYYNTVKILSPRFIITTPLDFFKAECLEIGKDRNPW